MNIGVHPLARILVDEKTGHKYQLIPLNDYSPSPETLSVHDVLCAVARASDVTVAGLKSAKRSQRYAFPRQLAYWCATQYTQASSGQIARAIGGRDSSTVRKGAQAIKGLLDYPSTHKAIEANRIIAHVQKRLGLAI